MKIPLLRKLINYINSFLDDRFGQYWELFIVENEIVSTWSVKTRRVNFQKGAILTFYQKEHPPFTAKIINISYSKRKLTVQRDYTE